MKTVKITTGLLAAFCLTAAIRAAAESAYADDYIETSDPAVRRVVTPTGVAYVFTNAAEAAALMQAAEAAEAA